MDAIVKKGRYFEDLEVGMEASYERTVTEADIVSFAQVSGDTNPVHLDEDYAAGTIFKQRIAHGMLTASYVSTVFGTRLPGPGAIYVSQTLNFRAPVRIGDHARRRVVQMGDEAVGRPEVDADYPFHVPPSSRSTSRSNVRT